MDKHTIIARADFTILICSESEKEEVLDWVNKNIKSYDGCSRWIDSKTNELQCHKNPQKKHYLFYC